MPDLSRSLVDAAAEAMKPFDDADLNWITVVDEAGDATLMSPATRRAVASRAAVAAVLETLAVHCDPVVIRPGSTEQALLSNSDLRGLAAEVKTGEDR